MKVLDLYCGAGGAGMGYHLAGAEVVGVDKFAQPNYPFEFHQGDVFDLSILWMKRFDVIHASPPCQFASRSTAWKHGTWDGDRSKHPNLIPATQALLHVVGKPYVIENVQDARGWLQDPIMLCGTGFGLNLQSHRYFETPARLAIPPPCNHAPGNYSRDHGKKQRESVFRDALGCKWMTVREAREAIPPAFTEWIGRQLGSGRKEPWQQP